MEKSKLYPVLDEIRMEISSQSVTLDLMDIYERVDAMIKNQDFYQETPYFLSEWLILKEQVARNDADSKGYLERFIDNIMHESATGVYDAFHDKTKGLAN